MKILLYVIAGDPSNPIAGPLRTFVGVNHQASRGVVCPDGPAGGEDWPSRVEACGDRRDEAESERLYIEQCSQMWYGPIGKKTSGRARRETTRILFGAGRRMLSTLGLIRRTRVRSHRFQGLQRAPATITLRAEGVNCGTRIESEGHQPLKEKFFLQRDCPLWPSNIIDIRLRNAGGVHVDVPV